MKRGVEKNKLVLAMNISRMALWKIEQRYKKWGEDGLKDHQPGRLFEPLSPKFYDVVMQEWKKTKYGARKLHRHLQQKGYGVSLRKISQVLVKEGFQKPNLKKQKPRKYKRYEWPIPNLMWHTDWHTDWHTMKHGSLKGKKILPYIDDCSRRIMSYGVFDCATEKNTIAVLYKAIAEHEVIPWELNSDRGSQFIPNKYDKKGEANHAFQIALAELGIRFIPSRKRHPQTNGKNEKWFDILEKEFDERFKDIDEFVRWYNEERISEALDYITPKKAYKKRL